MKIAIRTDASIDIGIGHVMRCLSLADSLKEKGAKVVFICREHKGNTIELIQNKGYVVHKLPRLKISDPGHNILKNKGSMEHMRWLGATQDEDAILCKEVLLRKDKLDWMIVDHYAIDETWQLQLKNTYNKLMVIDDLGNRKHICDILLDQTFGRKKTDYEALVPKHCNLLLGSQYALLRSDFIKWRKYSLRRRVNPQFRKLLITMGGVDSNNITGQVLDIIKNCKLPKHLEIVVIMGAEAPHIESVNKQAKMMPNKTLVRTNVANMAEIMADADLAIGAAGTTTWERCCLGVPSIQMVLANNQIEVAKKLNSVGASYYLEHIDWLCESIDNLSRKMQKTIIITSSISDGRGVDKVLSCMGQDCSSIPNLLLKPVALSDCNFVYTLQTEGIRKYFNNPVVPTSNEHIKWFEKTIKAKEIQLFILILDSQKAGVLRLNKLDDRVYEISIIISPNYTCQGVAKNALKMLEDILLNRTLKAVIHKDNTASIKVFYQAGFRIREKGKNGVFINYYKNII